MLDLTAVILCGGKGERLRPFTETMPKPLVALNNRPLLYHLLSYLAAGGVARFILCTGYKAEAIEAFAREHSHWPISCVNSGDASMTDRIIDARSKFSGRALVCYGDTLANVDLAGLLKQHQQQQAAATLTVYPLHSPFGIVNFDADGRVEQFVEKPQLPHWINIGFLLCEPAALDRLTPGEDMIKYLNLLAAEKLLFSYQHSGRHLTVNTEKERAEAESQIEFFTLLDGQKIL